MSFYAAPKRWPTLSNLPTSHIFGVVQNLPSAVVGHVLGARPGEAVRPSHDDHLGGALAIAAGGDRGRGGGAGGGGAGGGAAAAAAAVEAGRARRGAIQGAGRPVGKAGRAGAGLYGGLRLSSMES